MYTPNMRAHLGCAYTEFTKTCGQLHLEHRDPGKDTDILVFAEGRYRVGSALEQHSLGGVGSLSFVNFMQRLARRWIEQSNRSTCASRRGPFAASLSFASMFLCNPPCASPQCKNEASRS